MRNMLRLFASASVCVAAVAVSPASAAVFDITYGTALNAEITTAQGTGTTQTITGVTGTFLGSAITGIIANPYSPATAYYTDLNQQVYATPTAPVTTDPIYQYYNFNNLLFAGKSFDSNGLLFQTAANVVNLYTDGATQLIYSPRGTNVVPTSVGGSYAITPTGAVPEPASWAMMILGMGAVGYAMRRRKAVTTRVQFA